jgi:uncharacterized protein (TIGR02145 family)
MKTNHFLSLAAVLTIAIAFFACSNDSPSEPHPSSSSGEAMGSCQFYYGGEFQLALCMEGMSSDFIITEEMCTNPKHPDAIIVSKCADNYALKCFEEPLYAYLYGNLPSGTTCHDFGLEEPTETGGNLYCDFGPFTAYGGGCYKIDYASECDLKYGTIANSCSNRMYCDYGPVTIYGGGCFEIEDANDCDLEWGVLANSCGTTTQPSSSSSRPQTSSSSNPNSSSSRSDDSFVYQGQTYKTVKIGTQTWMAENLNYNVTGSKCYNNINSNCDIYGRLYDWATAMALASTCNSNSCSVSAKHKGICPSGWHIPSNAEWDVLINYAGGEDIGGAKLKAKSGWKSGGNGTDNYGFAALPGGFGTSDGNFTFAGDKGFWRSATEYDANIAYDFNMSYNSEDVYKNDGNNKSLGLLSGRCIKD